MDCRRKQSSRNNSKNQTIQKTKETKTSFYWTPTNKQNKKSGKNI